MTISAKAFLAIEASLSLRLQKALGLATSKLYKGIDVELGRNNFENARRLVGPLSLDSVFQSTEPYITYCTNLAMLFGASRVTPNPGTSVVGMGHEKTMVQQAVQSLGIAIGRPAEDAIKATALQLIALAETKHLSAIAVLKFNPHHDELGRFSTEDSTKATGVHIRSTSKHVMIPLSALAHLESTVNGEEAVERNKALIADGGDMKPIQLLKLPGMDELSLQDGNHRLQAARDAGATHIPAQILEVGTDFKFKDITESYKVKKADDRVIKDFASFMDASGKAYFNLVSSLHTSRVSAYGFTAEADAMGYATYQINEQLDNRTCKVCKHMHGKVFQVKAARALLDVALRAKNPEDLKHLQPWPPQDAESLKTMRAMSSDELVAQGWHIPPFHPGCRGLLARDGKAPTQDQMAQGTADDSYVATKEDFDALLVKTTPAQVSRWNSFANMSPVEMIARLQGKPLPEFMEALLGADTTEAVVQATGLTSFKIGPRVSIKTESQIYGSTADVEQTLAILPEAKQVVTGLRMAGSPIQADVVQAYLQGLVGVSRDMGMGIITLKAGSSLGAIESVQAGFLPGQVVWDKLRVQLTALYKANPSFATVPASEATIALDALESSDPKAIRTLLTGAPSLHLLDGLSWEASLNLVDAPSMSLFHQYLGSGSP